METFKLRTINVQGAFKERTSHVPGAYEYRSTYRSGTLLSTVHQCLDFPIPLQIKRNLVRNFANTVV